jgi:type I restriction enzyme S subunit
MVRGPGVVTGRYGTIGQVFYVSHDFWPLNTTLYVQDFKGNDKRFISYLLKTIDFHQFSDKAAVPGVNRNHLHAARIWLPPLSDQMRIAAVLQCLDDRIDLLRQTNATLEAIAQALFKSWFIDFDPVRAKAEGREPEGMDAATAALFPSEFEESPLGLIPKGWRIESLGHWLTVLETGRRPKGGVGRFSSGIPSVGAESIVRVGQYDFEKTKYVPTEFFATMKTGVLTSRDVLLYKDGGKPGVFLPRVSMFGDGYPFETCAINEHVFRLRAKEPIGQVFLYFWLWSDAVMHELKHRGGKAAIPGINQSDVKEQRLLIPHPAIAMSFEHATDALVSRIFCNAKSIQSLAALRDTLLPRLISGKLQLPEVRETVEDALS